MNSNFQFVHNWLDYNKYSGVFEKNLIYINIPLGPSMTSHPKNPLAKIASTHLQISFYHQNEEAILDFIEFEKLAMTGCFGKGRKLFWQGAISDGKSLTVPMVIYAIKVFLLNFRILVIF